MTKEELSNELVEWRRVSHMSSTQVAQASRMALSSTRSIEKGEKNYGINNVLLYLGAIGCCFHIYNEDMQKTFVIQHRGNLTSTIKKLCESHGLSSGRQLSLFANISGVAAVDVMKAKHDTSINIILTIIQAFNCTLKVMPIKRV